MANLVPETKHFSAKQILISYGLFLILAGLLGYLSNPARAQTALISGGVFGGTSLILGFLWRNDLMPGQFLHRLIQWASFSILALLLVVFSWRMLASWSAVLSGEDSKLFAAVLISSMWLATLSCGTLLARNIRRGR